MFLATLNDINWLQCGLLVGQATLVGGLLVGLVHLRRFFGFSLLYIALGVFQHIQVILAVSVYLEVYPGIVISPGSAVLFTATLFAVLLVYIREGVSEARQLCYGLLAANVVAGGLSLLFGFNLGSAGVPSFFDLPFEVFLQHARVMFVGTSVLALDILLIIVLYAWLNRVQLRPLFLRLAVTMGLVLTLDTLLFVTGSFAGQERYLSLLLSGVLGKGFGDRPGNLPEGGRQPWREDLDRVGDRRRDDLFFHPARCGGREWRPRKVEGPGGIACGGRGYPAGGSGGTAMTGRRRR